MKPTKEHFDKIKRLMDEVYELKNEVDDHVADVAYRYSNSKKYLNGAGPTSVGNFSDEWTIDGNVINCPWSDSWSYGGYSWSYGGYDEGVVTVPLVYFYDDEEFDRYLKGEENAEISRQN
jgi:hypothetical protein